MPTDTQTVRPKSGDKPSPDRRLSLEEHLVAAGHLNADQVDLALREQRRRGDPLTKVLIDLRLVTPEVISDLLGRLANTRSISLKGFTIPNSLMTLVPYELARRVNAVPVSRLDGVLTVALADPLDLAAIDALQHATGLTLDVLAATERDIIHCLEVNYHALETVGATIEEALEQKSQEPAQPLEELLGRQSNKEKDAPIIRLVSQIISSAVNSGASDIHFEPEEQMMRIRKRIDGALQHDVLIPKAMQSAVTTRMKILAELDLGETGAPQDGRANVMVAGRQVSLRVSSLPTRFGENIVARILDPEAQVINLSALGFATDTLERFREAFNRPYGVVLVTGPTGSGKSTTLYAVLKEISTPDVSTFTLEDPIEYVMPLVRQTQIKEERGLTFSAGLRALLRQDPDIILVGETRDTETAQLMVRAALTGHLVLSTLHTNDAPGAIPRLLDMGVEPFLLPASLIAVLAQRLVRTICPRCRQPVKNLEEVLQTLQIELPQLPDKLWHGAGCPHCRQSGYKGRMGIHELLLVDERFHSPIIQRAPASEYLRLGREAGMRTMFEDGMLKVAQGGITLEELWRVTRLS
jgi:type IV pilus assembly protein PilB